MRSSRYTSPTHVITYHNHFAVKINEETIQVRTIPILIISSYTTFTLSTYHFTLFFLLCFFPSLWVIKYIRRN
ncbi:hypothetical protein RIF29_29355 [Crotalaria pallida]|uniref:Uncharacterized protein n=1 Tax=Crotalaria pallida TaxID=3830 RepID=A0AAN9EEM2_CROPI